jgi:hypothetical protein
LRDFLSSLLEWIESNAWYSFGGGEDGVGIGFPNERLGVAVVGLDELVDGRLQRDEGREHAAFEPAFGERSEHGLDGVEPVEPRARGRGEVERS